MQVSVTGMVWYRAEDYDRLKAMFTDGGVLADTFDEWHESAQAALDTLTGEGITVLKAFIAPDAFAEWCRNRGMEMNAIARSAYASDYAAAKYRSKMK
jgi:hypothetical protein